MKIDFIKNIIEVAKECGCLVTITLVYGQVSHVNFSKHIKKFTTTDDVIYNEKEHIVTIIDTDVSCDYIDSDSIIRIFSKEGV
jgi:hypothetical protein